MNLGRGWGGREGIPGETSGGTPGAAPSPGRRGGARMGQSSWQRGKVPSRAGLRWSFRGEQFARRASEGRYSPVSLSAPVPLLLRLPAAPSDPAPRRSSETKRPRCLALLPLRPFHNKTPPIRSYPVEVFFLSFFRREFVHAKKIYQHNIFKIVDIILICTNMFYNNNHVWTNTIVTTKIAHKSLIQ